MKEMIRYGFILSLICTVASGLLVGVNALTKTRIIAQAQAEEGASLKEVMPEAADFSAVKKRNETIYYKAKDKDGNFIGVAFKVYAEGYSSTIETMVGMLEDGTITGVKVLAQNETPGLGTQVTEPGFLQQFSNKKIENLNEVQAITGATISSEAVMAAVKEKAEKIKALIKDEK
jgi:electron transport complex protein RnfG